MTKGGLKRMSNSRKIRGRNRNYSVTNIQLEKIEEDDKEYELSFRGNVNNEPSAPRAHVDDDGLYFGKY